LIGVARLLMGAIYFLNGFNWWFKIIAAYPSMSDFAHVAPPPDVVGAMIQNGMLFHIVKATELVTGLALLTNRFVPLMLVAALPVTLPICLVDMFFVATPRGILMGGGSMVLNGVLLLAYLNHYRAMLEPRGMPGLDVPEAPRDGGPLARAIAAVAGPMLPVLAALACLLGAAMLLWLIVMIVQYAIHPLSFWAAHAPPPR